MNQYKKNSRIHKLKLELHSSYKSWDEDEEDLFFLLYFENVSIAKHENFNVHNNPQKHAFKEACPPALRTWWSVLRNPSLFWAG
jgi:hypothetical protein